VKQSYAVHPTNVTIRVLRHNHQHASGRNLCGRLSRLQTKHEPHIIIRKPYIYIHTLKYHPTSSLWVCICQCKNISERLTGGANPHGLCVRSGMSCLDVWSQPCQAFVQAVARCCTRRLHIPIAISDTCQSEFFLNFVRLHCYKQQQQMHIMIKVRQTISSQRLQSIFYGQPC